MSDEIEMAEELLKEIAIGGTDAAASSSSSSGLPSAPLCGSPRRAGPALRAVGNTSVSFSTYRADTSGRGAGVDSTATVDPKEPRSLPKHLEPLRKPGLPAAAGVGAGAKSLPPSVASAAADGADPWSANLRTALPRLAPDSSGVSPAASPKASADPATAGAAPQARGAPAPPRGDTVLRCLGVKGGIVPAKRWGHGTCLLGGSVYVFGGMRGTEGASHDLHEFATESQVWESCFAAKGSPPEGRHSMGFVAHHDSVFVYGGVGQSGGVLADVHEYNTDTQEWVAHPSDSASTPARAEAGIHFVTNRRFVVFGGRREKDMEKKGGAGGGGGSTGERKKLAYANDVWSFDVKTKKWRVLCKQPSASSTTEAGASAAAYPAKRAGHASCVTEDKETLFVHGGNDTSRVFSDTWAFDLATHQWREVAIDGPPRSGHTLHVLSETLFVFGGLTEDTTSTTSGLARNTLLQWTPLPSPAATAAAAAAESTGQPRQYLQWQQISLLETPVFPAKGSVSHFGCAGIHHGTLVTFGGKVGTTISKEPSNNVFSLLLTNDIVVSDLSVCANMARLLRRTQARPAEWGADLSITVNGRSRFCHSVVLAARCPRFYELLQETASGRIGRGDGGGNTMVECVLDANKRRKGIPCIASSDLLLNILTFFYTGRLTDYDDVEALTDISLELKLAGLADFLSLLRQPAQVGGALRFAASSPRSKAAVGGSGGGGGGGDVKQAERLGQTHFLGDVQALLNTPQGRASADVVLTTDASHARETRCHSAFLAASSPLFRRILHHHASASAAAEVKPFSDKHCRVEVEAEGRLRVIFLDLPSRYAGEPLMA